MTVASSKLLISAGIKLKSLAPRTLRQASLPCLTDDGAVLWLFRMNWSPLVILDRLDLQNIFRRLGGCLRAGMDGFGKVPFNSGFLKTIDYDYEIMGPNNYQNQDYVQVIHGGGPKIEPT